MKIYAPVTAAALDWGFSNDQITNNLKVIESQHYRIAAVPAICNQPHMYCFRDMPPDLNLQWFDLVLISDIEYYSQAEIATWIKSQEIKNHKTVEWSFPFISNLRNSCIYSMHN